MTTSITPETRTLLVLSGQVCREHSRDLRNFWSGFINIQRTVNVNSEQLDIVAHSWSPEHDGLVHRVYSPIAYSSERQPDFSPEYMPLIDPVDRFEAGLKRARSTWKRVTPQAIIGNARSRSKAIALMKEITGDKYVQVISSRWDQGLTGSGSVNTLVHDPSLPAEYMYMAYYSEVDEGYADMWFVAPPDMAQYFSEYDQFVLNCLSGENGYIEKFTKTGWPLSISKENVSGAFLIRAKSLLARFPRIRLVNLAARLGDFAKHKAIGLTQKIERFVQRPEMTGENVIDCNNGVGEVVWPVYQALNNHAMLKYFVLQSGLRSNVRFLSPGDFDSPSGRACTLINPVQFPLVVYSHSSFSDCWEIAIEQAKIHMPDNCISIVLLSEDSEESRASFEQLQAGDNVELLCYQDSQPYTERLRTSFETLSETWPIIYFMHEDMPLFAPVDAPYLNALLHYLQEANELFVKLVDTSMVDEKHDHPAFPGLKWNIGGYSISVQPSLIKAKEFAAFLTNFRCSIYDFENLCEGSNFKASAVAGEKRIGKYLLSNQRFPHIATAISKGKWCVSEWPDEIHQLAKQYSIDISVRGMV
jgi:hypothetical protein